VEWIESKPRTMADILGTSPSSFVANNVIYYYVYIIVQYILRNTYNSSRGAVKVLSGLPYCPTYCVRGRGGDGEDAIGQGESSEHNGLWNNYLWQTSNGTTCPAGRVPLLLLDVND